MGNQFFKYSDEDIEGQAYEMIRLPDSFGGWLLLVFRRLLYVCVSAVSIVVLLGWYTNMVKSDRCSPPYVELLILGMIFFSILPVVEIKTRLFWRELCKRKRIEFSREAPKVSRQYMAVAVVLTVILFLLLVWWSIGSRWHYCLFGG